MSRPIDADALMQAMYHRAFETDGDTMWQSGCWVRYRAIEQTVKEQPTIEPKRKMGEWMDYTEDGYVECPFCHSATNCDGNKEELHFCFSCGAEMKGDQDE